MPQGWVGVVKGQVWVVREVKRQGWEGEVKRQGLVEGKRLGLVGKMKWQGLVEVRQQGWPGKGLGMGRILGLEKVIGKVVDLVRERMPEVRAAKTERNPGMMKLLGRVRWRSTQGYWQKWENCWGWVGLLSQQGC